MYHSCNFCSYQESYGSESGEELATAADRRTRERSRRNVSNVEERSRNAREGTSDSVDTFPAYEYHSLRLEGKERTGRWRAGCRLGTV